MESNLKQCSICKEFFPATLEYFYKNKNSKESSFPYCKKCTSKKSKKWSESNHDKRLVFAKRYNSLETTKEKNRGHNKVKRERGYDKQWQQNNPEKLKQYGLNHKNHTITKKEWLSCKEYFNNCCAYCGLPIEEHFVVYGGVTRLGDFHKEHVDHKGESDLSNCVPSCKSCNSKKHTSTLDEWYNSSNERYSEERYGKIIKWVGGDYMINN